MSYFKYVVYGAKNESRRQTLWRRAYPRLELNHPLLRRRCMSFFLWFMQNSEAKVGEQNMLVYLKVVLGVLHVPLPGKDSRRTLLCSAALTSYPAILFTE